MAKMIRFGRVLGLLFAMGILIFLLNTQKVAASTTENNTAGNIGDTMGYLSSPNTNYGSPGADPGITYLYMGTVGAGGDRTRSYILWDLTFIPAGSIIDNAMLWIYNYYIQANGMSLYAYSLDNTNWNENVITWNAPPTGDNTYISKGHLPSAGNPPADPWSWWDVTSAVQANRDNNDSLSILIYDNNTNLTRTNWRPRNYAATDPTKVPHLQVTYHAATVENHFYLIESWSGAASAPTSWKSVESWTSAVSAPASWGAVESWSGTVSSPSTKGWYKIESWSGAASAPAWGFVEGWSGASGSNIRCTITWPPDGFHAYINRGIGFTSSAGGSITSYHWDFGDNAGISSEQNTTYGYSSPGDYHVQLTVSDGSNTATDNVLVVITYPLLDITGGGIVGPPLRTVENGPLAGPPILGIPRPALVIALLWVVPFGFAAFWVTTYRTRTGKRKFIKRVFFNVAPVLAQIMFLLLRSWGMI